LPIICNYSVMSVNLVARLLLQASKAMAPRLAHLYVLSVSCYTYSFITATTSAALTRVHMFWNRRKLDIARVRAEKNERLQALGTVIERLEANRTVDNTEVTSSSSPSSIITIITTIVFIIIIIIIISYYY
jgi:hypothetical protein